MTEEKIEQVAQYAYGIYSARFKDVPPWGTIRNQHEWRDTARSFLAHPKVAPVGGLEECIKAALVVLENTEPGHTPVIAVAQPVEEKPVKKVTKKKE